MVRIVAGVAILIHASAAGAATGIGKLRCEQVTEPLAIETRKPRLSWIMESDERGQKQTAYQVIATSDGGVLWDSGRAASDQSVGVEYAGKPLAARQRVTWKVRVWDKDGKVIESPSASFEMGLLGAKDWEGAKWIGLPPTQKIETLAFDPRPMRWIWYPDPGELTVEAPKGDRILRRALELPADAKIRRAQFAFSADGRGTLFVNGKKAGDSGGNSSPNLVDIAPLLQQGKNDLEVRASNGGEAAGVVGQLVVKLDKGPPVVVSTDGRWTAAKSENGPWVPARELARIGEGKHWKDLSVEKVTIETFEAAPMLRKTFTVGGKVKRARLYATALGWYELHMNGQRVGRDYFAPGWTDYDKRLQYQSYDVTALVRPGKNALGALLGDGWYNGHVGLARRHMYGHYPLRLRALLHIEREDGGRQVIASDGSWRGTIDGPIRLADLMRGEVYDARKEIPGWSSADFRDTGWQKIDARQIDKRLVAEPSPSVRVTQELAAISVKEPKPGIFVFDLGQNMVGWVRLDVKGPAGTTVTLRHAEMLNPDGTLYTENLRQAKATDQYILRGAPEGETWEPRFTFHGFRYVEVSGYPGRPPLDAITGRVAHSDTPRTGTFQTSSKLINQLVRNIEWGQRGNFLSVPTDCPQRDERLGWTGDAQVFVRTACQNMDVAAFFTKWMRDMADAQTQDGGFPDTAPRVPGNRGGAAPGWGDAGVIVPWVIYDCYADRRILEEHFPAMVKWVEYIRRPNPDLIWKHQRNADYGEWLSIAADTDKEALATAFFAWSTQLVARAARVLGRAEEAAKYEALFRDIRAAFNKAYVKPDGSIKSDTQAIYAVALRFGLLDDAIRPLVVKRLVDDIAKRSWHLSTGFLGVAHLLPALTDAGRTDVAYRLLNQETFPSWGYSIKHGATTIWERWDGWTADKGFQTPGMNSFNHYSFGAVGEWLYGTVAGIQAAAPGYKKIRLAAQPGGGLTRLDATLETVHGRIESHWTVEGKRFKWRVHIPPNVTATIELPGKPPVAAEPGTHELEAQL